MKEVTACISIQLVSFFFLVLLLEPPRKIVHLFSPTPIHSSLLSKLNFLCKMLLLVTWNSDNLQGAYARIRFLFAPLFLPCCNLLGGHSIHLLSFFCFPFFGVFGCAAALTISIFACGATMTVTIFTFVAVAFAFSMFAFPFLPNSVLGSVWALRTC